MEAETFGTVLCCRRRCLSVVSTFPPRLQHPSVFMIARTKVDVLNLHRFSRRLCYRVPPSSVHLIAAVTRPASESTPSTQPNKKRRPRAGSLGTKSDVALLWRCSRFASEAFASTSVVVASDPRRVRAAAWLDAVWLFWPWGVSL